MLPIDGLQSLLKGRWLMTKHKQNQRYERVRADSGHHRRILATMAVFCILAFIPVGCQLYSLMIFQHDYYAKLALRNQTRTTKVTADRGKIYDCNMNILAASVSVENVFLDPHELKQAKEDIDAGGQKTDLQAIDQTVHKLAGTGKDVDVPSPGEALRGEGDNSGGGKRNHDDDQQGSDQEDHNQNGDDLTQ